MEPYLSAHHSTFSQQPFIQSPSATFYPTQILNQQIQLQLEETRKQLFQEAAANLMLLYKESLKRCEESYYQGKEDAFEEVLKWFLSFNNNGDFKHVSSYEFFQFINMKLQEHRGSKRRNQSVQGNISNNSGSIGQQNLLSSRMPQQQLNLMTNYNDQNQNLTNEYDSQQLNNQDLRMSQREQIIELLAQQTEKEAKSEKLNFINRINFQLSDIKIQDSKKRQRPNYINQSFNQFSNTANQSSQQVIRNNNQTNSLFSGNQQSQQCSNDSQNMRIDSYFQEFQPKSKVRQLESVLFQNDNQIYLQNFNGDSREGEIKSLFAQPSQNDRGVEVEAQQNASNSNQ